MRFPDGSTRYVVLLAGGIGSGKTTAGRILENLGCQRIDLDQLSREVLSIGSPLIPSICEAFGHDLVDAKTGELNRGLLGKRAFASKRETARLESLELPAIRQLLMERLQACAAEADLPGCCLVEVPLLDRMVGVETSFPADETMVIWCPRSLRRERAIGRGMTGEDFDARSAYQPTDEWLRDHATTLIDNSGASEELGKQLHAWYERHEREGWQ